MKLSSQFVMQNVNKSIKLIEKGQYDEAIASLKSILSSNKNLEIAIRALGVCYIKTKNYTLAEKIFKDVYIKDRKSFDAVNNLGVISMETKNLELSKSWFGKALEIRPNDINAKYNLANVNLELGNYEAAEIGYQQCLNDSKYIEPILRNLGILYLRTQRYQDAISVFKEISDKEPNNFAAHLHLAIAYGNVDENVAALKEYEKSIEIEPQNTELLLNISGFLRDRGIGEKALFYIRQVETSERESLKVMKLLASVLRNLGRRVEASELYVKIIEMSPEDYAQSRLLSVADPGGFPEKLLHDLEGKIEVTHLPEEKSQIGNALFNVYENRKEYHRAFSYLTTANEAEKAFRKYNISSDVDYFRKVDNWDLSTNDLQSCISDSAEMTPIFIIGMPRSGTSILEQIISVNEKCAAFGELPYVRKFVEARLIDKTLIGTEDILDFRKYFITRIRDLMTVKEEKREIFIDKMPHNFLFTRLLAAAFPEGKFIHLYRNPGATCWSNYTKFFPARGLSYSFDLDDLVSYYGLYREHMTKISDTLGERVFHLGYEALTEDLEGSTRRLMAYLNFDWQEEMLSPHLNTRSVRTASSLQVKKPVYKGSSEAWLNYREFVGDRFDSLVPFGEAGLS